MLPLPNIRIATRRSALAITQSTAVGNALVERGAARRFELVEQDTSGDAKRDRGAGELRDKKDWIIELEELLLSGDADAAVHSGKDVPLDIVQGTEVLPLLARANPRDVLIVGDRQPGAGREPDVLPMLKHGARVGTASLRRGAQLLNIRPDLKIGVLRGNVPTRVERIKQGGDFDAAVIAAAGLQRLGLSGEATSELPVEVMLPAVHQGILVGQFRADRPEIKAALMRLGDTPTIEAFRVERAFIEKIGADCKSSVAVFSSEVGGVQTVRARVLSPDGKSCIDETVQAGPDLTGPALGARLADACIARGALELL